MTMRAWLAGAAISLLAACTAVPQPAAGNQIPLPKLTPASFAGSVNLVQRLTISRQDGETATVGQVEALLEIDPATVKLAGFALGQRMLTLTWDGRQLQMERHPQLPGQVDGARILRDIQFVYWPAAAINTVLPPGWMLHEAVETRTLLYDGKPVLTVRYAAAVRWKGRAELENAAEGYRLTIDSAEQADVSTP
ncbi:MAG: DUF3261 domain-containing protein [Pseudomonadota bacterium]